MLRRIAIPMLVFCLLLMVLACAAPAPTPTVTPTLTLTAAPTVTPDAAEPLEILGWRVDQKFPKGVEIVVDLRDGRSPPDLRASRLTVRIKGMSHKVAPKRDQGSASPNPNQVVFAIDGGNNFIVWTEIDGGTLEIVDRQGNMRTETIGPFVYEDTRFTWETRESERVKVLFYGPQDLARPETALEEVETLFRTFSITPKRKIRVVVYGNKPEMDRAIPFRSKKNQEQMVTLGMAFSDIDAVFVSREGSPIDLGTLRHEVMHYIVHIYAPTAEKGGAVPSWLNEGLAEYARSKELSPSEQFQIHRALQSGKLMPLSWLKSFSGTPDVIMLSYLESHSFVIFLVETYGLDKMLELLYALEADLTRTVDKAVEEVYGKSLDALEQEWLKKVRDGMRM
jgi:hypothetical protein